MNDGQFTEILSARIQAIVDTLGSKAKEYAIGDRLYNFKRAAEISRTTPAKALAGMWMKHVVSVIDLIEGSTEPTAERINEKIGDAINYLILLEAIFAESRGAGSMDDNPLDEWARKAIRNFHTRVKACEIAQEVISETIKNVTGRTIPKGGHVPKGTAGPNIQTGERILSPERQSELTEIARNLKAIHDKASGDA